jgi:2-polyprenyl-3-methyl-5-hydroxy-6-metoxy-1,4-benzoquinol methylase
MLNDLVRQRVTDRYPDSNVVCAGCNGSARRLLGCKNGYELMECQGCGNISAKLEQGQAAGQEIYQHYYGAAPFDTPPVTAASLDRLVASFEGFRSTGRLIDIGYGEGGLLNAAERRGWTCYGTEIDSRALEYGRRRGWVVSGETSGDERFPDHGFDVLTMIEFIEHVPDPERFLKAARRLLRPEGILYLTTPNAQSLNSLLLGLKWSVFCPPDHLTIWTTRGLRAALARAGFRCRRIRREGLNPCEIIGGLSSRNNSLAAPINRQQAALKLNNTLSSSVFRRMVKRGLNQILSTFRAGDNIKVWATTV